MKLETAGQTDVGRKRSHNEDNFYLMHEQSLFLVADGMGGHAAGEVASKLAIDTVVQFFKDTAEDEEVTWPYKMDKGVSYEENRLATGVKLSNLRIHETGVNNPDKKGMGTTLVGTHFIGNVAILAHVGDSRIYRLRDNKLKQLTEDHSLLNDYIKMKELTEEDIKNFPHKNVIVRALGMKETVQVDVITDHSQLGDMYMLCSDGLSGMIEDPQIEELMVHNRDNVKRCCSRLIDLANKNGGIDNITVVVVKVITK